MIIASDPASNFPKAAIEHLKRIPVIVLDTKETITSKLAHVAFRTATYGINTGGTVYRMDDVPITLRKAFDSPFPTDEDILTALRKRVQELLAAKRGPHGAASMTRAAAPLPGRI
jgi:formylmethanofuran dehydrogenase subunit B